MTKEQILSSFSDLHKDAFGFRPREYQWNAWKIMTLEQLQHEEDYMVRELERSIEREKAEQAAAATRFEKTVADTIQSGAKDRETAIRWLMDAANVNGDVGYFEYQMGLKYGYVEGAIR